MTVLYYHWVFIICLIIFLVVFISLLIKTIITHKPEDFSRPSEQSRNATIYAFTTSMSPAKKESAYLHLPTYAAGLIFHLGTFLSIALLLLMLFQIEIPELLRKICSAGFSISAVCGLSIFLKRVSSNSLRSLSIPDDYFSNLLVTVFQSIMACTLFLGWETEVVFIYASILMLYIPFGKLKHTIYFFASRIYLSRFYGKRGVWPVVKR